MRPTPLRGAEKKERTRVLVFWGFSGLRKDVKGDHILTKFSKADESNQVCGDRTNACP